MLKIMLDYSYLKALLFENQPNHLLAENMAKTIIETEYLFVPSYVLNRIFDDIGKEYNETTRKFFNNICCSTRNIRIISREMQKKAFELYEQHPSLGYEECLNVTLMKSNDMRHIISFNENYDSIPKIKRLYDLDEYSNNKLNYMRYE